MEQHTPTRQERMEARRALGACMTGPAIDAEDIIKHMVYVMVNAPGTTTRRTDDEVEQMTKWAKGEFRIFVRDVTTRFGHIV